jgi:hypothetical protein
MRPRVPPAARGEIAAAREQGEAGRAEVERAEPAAESQDPSVMNPRGNETIRGHATQPSTLVRRLDAFEGLHARANLYRDILQVHVKDLETTLTEFTTSVETLLNQKAAA